MGSPLDDHADAVRARLAHLVLRHRSVDTQVGEFVLRESQRTAVSQIRRAFREFGGALLADPPGTGKTVVALAVAREFLDVLVVLPAELRSQWERAAARGGIALRFCSFEALSRGAKPTPAALVVVDEAHHVRTARTARYEALAATCVGARVLLLSATPIVNRARDRTTLLGLFLGSRAETLPQDALSRVIIRRKAEASLLPRVVSGDALEQHADVPGIGDALASLPPALPTVDGSPASALTRITLAFAWCSSLAALDATLRRRLQRGAALRDALVRGRWPDRRALREWVMAEDSTQLAFAELLTPEPPATASIAEARCVIDEHLRACDALRALIAPHIAHDTARRAAALRTVLYARPDERIVVFAHHADTVRALWRALRGEPGVVAITGARVEAAAGRWKRQEVLRVIGSVARPRSLDPRAIRLVLSTDLLSEGVEMAGVRTVVHADLPWTPARVEQRRGRITRAGSGTAEVHELRFALPRGALPLVRLFERLRRKRAAIRSGVDPAMASSALEALLRSWRATSLTSPPPPPCIAAISSCGSPSRPSIPAASFLAAVVESSSTFILAGVRSESGWRVSSSPRRVLAVARDACGAGALLDPSTVREVRRAIARTLRARDARSLLGDRAGRTTGFEHRRGLRSLVRRTLDRVQASLRRSSLSERTALAERIEELHRMLDRPLSVEAEHRLDGLLSEPLGDAPFIGRLGVLLSAASAADAVPANAGAARRPRYQLGALLIILPPDDRPGAQPAPP